MSESLMNNDQVKDLITKVSGLTNDAGNPRMKRIMYRLSLSELRQRGQYLNQEQLLPCLK